MSVDSETHRTKRIDKIRANVGLGRRAAPDPKDHLHLLKGVIRPELAKVIETRTWAFKVGPLDQGQMPFCVAYAWAGMLFAAPMTHKAMTFGVINEFAEALYARAQVLDEWPGENYNGTSVRAGAKALVEQGRLGEYLWAFDANTARDFVLTRGCLVLGTDWYEEMFLPDIGGYIRPKGGIAGGHAYLAVGFNRKRDAFRILNSWGPQWGSNGRCWLKREDLGLLLMADGEACSAVEIHVHTGTRPVKGASPVVTTP